MFMLISVLDCSDRKRFLIQKEAEKLESVKYDIIQVGFYYRIGRSEMWDSSTQTNEARARGTSLPGQVLPDGLNDLSPLIKRSKKNRVGKTVHSLKTKSSKQNF